MGIPCRDIHKFVFFIYISFITSVILYTILWNPSTSVSLKRSYPNLNKQSKNQTMFLYNMNSLYCILENWKLKSNRIEEKKWSYTKLLWKLRFISLNSESKLKTKFKSNSLNFNFNFTAYNPTPNLNPEWTFIIYQLPIRKIIFCEQVSHASKSNSWY